MRVELLRPLPDLLQGKIDITRHALARLGQVFQFVPRIDHDQLALVANGQRVNHVPQPSEVVLVIPVKGAVNDAEMIVSKGKEVLPLLAELNK